MSREEIQQILTEESPLRFEEISGENTGPLSEPVVEKTTAADQFSSAETEEEKPPSPIWADETTDKDAPTQNIDPYSDHTEQESTTPLSSTAANQAAEAILGVTDNVLEIGGGYLVRIHKAEAFYEFEQIIEVIDEQNQRNINRIKLEKEDKILLTPLLAQVLKKRASYLTPEQQLLGAAASILLKKAQVVAQIKAENQALVERIVAIVKEQKESNNPPSPAETKNEEPATTN